MELNSQLEELLQCAEAAVERSFREAGEFAAFALAMQPDGTIDHVQPVAGEAEASNPLTGLFAALITRVRANAIVATVICMPIVLDGKESHAVMFGLEHKDMTSATVIRPMHKRLFRGWTLGSREIKELAPRLFASAHGVDLDHGDFTLRLSGDWQQHAGTDAGQFVFSSELSKTSVVISSVPASLPKERLLEAAGVLAEARQRGEAEADPARRIVYGDRRVELKQDGEVGHVAYAGYDDRGNIFRFMGWVTRAKFLSLWVSTETQDNEFSKRVFDEVFKGLRFTIP